MNPHPPFQNRRDAGRQLGATLMHLKQSDPVVLALPRGGVPVAFEIAKALNVPLNILLVQKIGSPLSAEVGLGAVVDGDPPRRILNEAVVQYLQPSAAHIDAEVQRQAGEIARRRQLYLGERQRINTCGRTVIVVDDGIATGSTMKAALQALAGENPKRLIFAVPVAPRDTLGSLYEDANDGICLLVPEHFRAVGQYYADFEQTTDDEVIALLATPTVAPAASVSDIMAHDAADVAGMTEGTPQPSDADEIRPCKPQSEQAGSRL